MSQTFSLEIRVRSDRSEFIRAVMAVLDSRAILEIIPEIIIFCVNPEINLITDQQKCRSHILSVLNIPYLRPYTRIFTRTVLLDIFECLNTVRLTGECNRKVPVKYTAVTVIRYGEQP